jgi:MFS family permease
MADVQQRNQATAVEIDQEKHVDTEHREVATSGSEGDGEQIDHSDHFHNTPWTVKDRLAALSLSGLYVGKYLATVNHSLLTTHQGSQIPLYFTGGSLSFIAADIGGATASAWLPVSYALALAAVAPFSGYLQDLVGRRNITLAGGLVLCVGIVVLATAKQFSSGVVGMALAGAGAAIGELTALAGYVVLF